MRKSQSGTPDRSWPAVNLADAYSCSIDAPAREADHMEGLLLCVGQHVYSEVGPGQWEGFHAKRFFKQWCSPGASSREDGQRLIGFFSWMVRGGLVAAEDAVPIVASISERTGAKLEALEPPATIGRAVLSPVPEPRLWEHIRREGVSRVRPLARKFANSTQTIKRKRVTAEWVITKLIEHIGEQPVCNVDPGSFCSDLGLRSGQTREVGQILCDFYLWNAKAGAIGSDEAAEVVELALLDCPGLAAHGERTLERLMDIPLPPPKNSLSGAEAVQLYGASRELSERSCSNRCP